MSLVRTVLWGPWAMGPCGSWDLCVWDGHFLPQQRTLAVTSGTASPPPSAEFLVGEELGRRVLGGHREFGEWCGVLGVRGQTWVLLCGHTFHSAVPMSTELGNRAACRVPSFAGRGPCHLGFLFCAWPRGYPPYPGTPETQEHLPPEKVGSAV